MREERIISYILCIHSGAGAGVGAWNWCALAQRTCSGRFLMVNCVFISRRYFQSWNCLNDSFFYSLPSPFCSSSFLVVDFGYFSIFAYTHSTHTIGWHKHDCASGTRSTCLGKHNIATGRRTWNRFEVLKFMHRMQYAGAMRAARCALHTHTHSARHSGVAAPTGQTFSFFAVGLSIGECGNKWKIREGGKWQCNTREL